MNAKENWIHETENSLNGLKPVEVNPYLYSKVLNRLNTKIEKAPAKLVWATALSFTFLLLVNVLVLKGGSANKKSETLDLQVLAKQYQLMNDNTFNYN